MARKETLISNKHYEIGNLCIDVLLDTLGSKNNLL